MKTFIARIELNNASVSVTDREIDAAIREGLTRLAVREFLRLHDPQGWPPSSYLQMFEAVEVREEI